MPYPDEFTAAGRRVLDAHPNEKPPAAERAELVRLYCELTGVTKAKAAVVVKNWLYRSRGTLLYGSGAGMPSKGSKEAQKASNKKTNAKWNPKNNAKWNKKTNAKTSARKAAAREAWEQAAHPEVDLSDEAKSDAADGAITIFDAALASALERHPSVACNIFGASEGSKGFSIAEEGRSSVLTGRGYDLAAIMAPSAEGGLRYLSGAERRSVGLPSIEIYNAANSKVLSKHVETAVQRHVDSLVKNDRRVKKLWRKTGAGGPKGVGPYKVGVRFFPTDRDGKLIDPFVFTF